MMTKVISIVSGKGGTGKSTISIGICASLAKANHRVLLIDLDIGLRSLDIMLNIEDKIVYDIMDIIDGRCSAQKAIVSCPNLPNLHLLSAPFNISKSFDITQVANLITAIKNNFDYVVLDNSAGIGTGIYMARAISDSAIVVTTADNVAVRDAAKIVSTIASKAKIPCRLIINKVNRQSLSMSEFTSLDDIIDIVGAQLIGVVPSDYAIQQLFNKIDYNENLTQTSQIFKNITQRIEGKYVPLLVKSL
ncbi:MAG: AAA family ATPase [Oscillospiraceae bacterium]